jgi:integrase
MSSKRIGITKDNFENELVFPTPEKGQKIYWQEKCPGLGMRVTAGGSRSWIVQGYVNGKSCRVTLAPVAIMTPTKARAKTLEHQILMNDGIDPTAEKRRKAQVSEAESATLADIMRDYIEHKRTKGMPLRPASIKGIENCVENEFKDWANKPVVNINRDAVIERFRKVSKKAPTQANLAFRNLRALLNWAKEKYTAPDGSYTILNPNPVSQAIKANGLAQWNKETKRDSRIPEDKIGKVWLALEEYADPARNITTTCVSADLIMFMLLTGTRISEANQLTWDRVDLEDEVPTFHLDVTKNHSAITLPISNLLKEVLLRRSMYRLKGNNYVFPAVRGKQGYLKDPRALFLKVSEIAGCHIHPHAMRRTFEELAVRSGVDSDRRRILLNHISGDVHALHYGNNKDPKVLMHEVNKVGDFVTRLAEIASSPATQKVVAIR